MHPRRSLRFLTVSIGIALLFAGLFFGSGTAISRQLQTAGTPVSTPTIDRLAEPTLPASPSQTDLGARLYWLHCLPCHGDRGQGLTEEFKQTYPVEDRNCWNSGCHGNRPYENGFTLPMNIPAVIGTGTLQKFPNAAVLRSYIFAAMPYWRPASLPEEETWQITAFLLRENNLWAAQDELNASNADTILIGTPMVASAPQSVPFATTPVLIITGIAILILFIVLQQKLPRKK